MSTLSLLPGAYARLFSPRSLTALARTVVLASAVLLTGPAHAVTNLYSTRFEFAEGYDTGYELIGQNEWTTDSASFGGNGLLTNSPGSQAAYIGLYPLDPSDSYLALWRPINYAPLQTSNPVVQFSVRMSIVDSTAASPNRDDFYWSVYNTNGHNLLTLDFWNEDLGIYYALDNPPDLIYSGVDFTNDVTYTLTVTMDFERNKWWAALDNRTIVTNVAISASGAPLSLGDVDAMWVIGNTSEPGDNYMIFDNYQVSAAISPNMPPKLTSLGKTNGQYALSLEGAFGARYAIDATTNLLQWAALSTNRTTNGVFGFRDAASAAITNRYYRGRLVR